MRPEVPLPALWASLLGALLEAGHERPHTWLSACEPVELCEAAGAVPILRIAAPSHAVHDFVSQHLDRLVRNYLHLLLGVGVATQYEVAPGRD